MTTEKISNWNWDVITRVFFGAIGTAVTIIGFFGVRYINSVDKALTEANKSYSDLQTTMIKIDQSLHQQSVYIRDIKSKIEENSNKTYDLTKQIYILKERVSLLEKENEFRKKKHNQRH